VRAAALQAADGVRAEQPAMRCSPALDWLARLSSYHLKDPDLARVPPAETDIPKPPRSLALLRLGPRTFGSAAPGLRYPGAVDVVESWAPAVPKGIG